MNHDSSNSSHQETRTRSIEDARTPKEAQSSNIYVQITFLMQAVVTIALATFLLRREWQNVFLTALVISLNILPTFIFKRYRVILPPEFQLVSVLFVFLAVFLGSVADFSNRFWWWDLVLHASSGFVLGIVGFLAVFLMNQSERVPHGIVPSFVCFFGVLFAVFLGVIWEIFEFMIDRFSHADMQNIGTGVVDTMQDLILDLLGATVVSLMALAYLKTGRYSFIADGIRTFQRKNPHLFQRSRR